MATWLNDYKNRKLSLEPLLQRGKMTVQELLVYQELLYRIQILETCQSLCTTAPVQWRNTYVPIGKEGNAQ